MRLALMTAMLAACAPAVAATAPAAMTADQLVARNLAARGGADKIAALKSVGFKGQLIFPGDFKLDYDEVRARGSGPDRARVNATLQGLTVVSAYDGAQGWRINPFQGRRDAETMSADEARSIADSSRIVGPLLDAKRDGSTVQYLGREDFDGTDAHKLKVTQKDGDEYVYLLDPDSWLEIKVTESRRIRGAQQVSETELGDYEAVGGVMFPMAIDSWQAENPAQRQRIRIASATANPPAADTLFTMPMAPATRQATAATSGQADADRSAVPKPQSQPNPPAAEGPATPPQL